MAAPSASSSRKRSLDKTSDQAPKRKFRTEWQKEFTWLRFDEVKQKMFCSLCEKANRKNPFAKDGCINFQHSTLVKHAGNNDHQIALNEVKLRKQFERCVEKVNITAGNATKASFHTVYCMVKEEMPLSKFSALVKLQIKNGCDDLKKITHQHPSHVSEMVEIISASILEKDIRTIKESPFIGVLIDETSDITIHKKLVILFKVIVNGECQTIFGTNANVHNGKADSLVQALLQFFNDKEISITKCMGLGSDGAPVMLGRLNGVGAQLTRLNPYLVQVHCVAHKLALCLSNAAQTIRPISNYKDLILAVYNYFSNSAVRYNKLRDMEQTLGDPELQLREPIYTRWLSLHASVEIVSRIWHSLVLTFEDQASGQADGVSANDAAKAKGLLIQIKSFVFVATTALLSDLLSVLARLSKSFQAQSLDLSMIHPLIDAAKTSVNNMQHTPGAQLQEILDLIDADELKDNPKIQIGYKNAAVEVTLAGYTTFLQTKESLIQEVVNNIDRRFPNDTLTVLDALAILNPKRCPLNPSACNYGNQELQILLDHYGKEKNATSGPLPPIIDEDATKFEWEQLRLLIAANYRHLSLKELAKLLITSHQDLYPNFASLSQIALIIPVTNADSERAFSTQNREKSKLRNRLSHATIDHLMRIETNGPPELDDFVDECVLKWQQARRGR